MAPAIQPAVPPPTMAMSRTRLSTILLDELSMARQAAHGGLHQRPHMAQGGLHFADIENVRERIVVLRLEVLAEQQREPAVLAEMLLFEHRDAPALAVQLELGT